MKATEIKLGRTYEVTAGRNKTKVNVTKFNPKTGSWECETESGKTISIKDCKRFLAEVGKKPSALQTAVETVKAVLPKGKGKKVEAPTNDTATEIVAEKPKRERAPRPDGTVSGLEAALIVLRDSGEPMNIKQIMEKINERGLAKLNGKTPDATISAALQREINSKGENSRFEKAGKGLFATR